MKVGEEYRLQTTEGAEWDRAFREQQGALSWHDDRRARRRSRTSSSPPRCRRSLARSGRSTASRRSPRSLSPSLAPTRRVGGGEVVVWLRDGSSSSQKDVESEARRRGHEDPVVHVFLQRSRRRSPEGTHRRGRGGATRSSTHKGMPSEPQRRVEAKREHAEPVQGRGEARDELMRELVAARRSTKAAATRSSATTFSTSSTPASEASLVRSSRASPRATTSAWPAR
jgi:hypothetical protein